MKMRRRRKKDRSCTLGIGTIKSLPCSFMGIKAWEVIAKLKLGGQEIDSPGSYYSKI